MDTIRNTDRRLWAYWKQGRVILMAVVAGKAFSLLWKILLARSGPQTLGTVEIALTVFFTLQAFSLLGFQTALMRFTTIATHENDVNRRNSLFFLSLRITLIISFVLVGFLTVFPDLLIRIFRESTPVITSVVRHLWIVPVMVTGELLWAYWAATRHMTRYAVGKYVLPPVFRLLSLGLLLWLGASGQISVIHIVVAAACATAFSVILSGNILHVPVKPLSKDGVTEFLRFTMPMSGSFLLYALFGAADVTLVGHFLGAASVGLLSAAVLFADIPDMVMTPMLNIFQVHLGSFHKTRNLGLLFALKNIAVFLMVGTILALVIFVASPFIVPVTLGASFNGAISLIGWILLSKVTESALVLPLRHALDFYGHTRVTLLLMVMSTLAKILAGLYAIPHYGLFGVVIMQWAGIGIHLAGTIIACRVLLYPSAGKASRI